jgi:hypothetical protein
MDRRFRRLRIGKVGNDEYGLFFLVPALTV